MERCNFTDEDTDEACRRRTVQHFKLPGTGKGVPSWWNRDDPNQALWVVSFCKEHEKTGNELTELLDKGFVLLTKDELTVYKVMTS